MYMKIENFLLVSFKMLLPNHFKECYIRVWKRHVIHFMTCVTHVHWEACTVFLAASNKLHIGQEGKQSHVRNRTLYPDAASSFVPCLDWVALHFDPMSQNNSLSEPPLRSAYFTPRIWEQWNIRIFSIHTYINMIIFSLSPCIFETISVTLSD
jgi:hypothetical protein